MDAATAGAIGAAVELGRAASGAGHAREVVTLPASLHIATPRLHEAGDPWNR